MPLYEITLNQRFNDSEVFINRFIFRLTPGSGGTGSAADLAEGFGLYSPDSTLSPDAPFATWFDAITAIQSIAMLHVSANVNDLYNLDDFVIVGINQTGRRENPPAPPFVATGFRGLRTSRAVRNAQKRFGGIPDIAEDNGGFLDPDYLTLCRGVEDRFAQPVTGSSGVYDFVTLSLKKVDTVVNGETVRKYEKWPTEEEAMQNSYPVSEWQTYGRVRSQVSRQYFRGQ